MSKMVIQPYLSFEGRCEEAIEFYKRALGAEVAMLMHFRDAPPSDGQTDMPPPDKVMHAAVRIGETTIFATDGFARGPANFAGITLSLTVENDAEAKRTFAALADGGTVRQALSKTFFSSSFGVLTDRFGVPWMVLVTPS